VRAAIEHLASALAEAAEQATEVSGFAAPKLPNGGTDFMKLTPVLGPQTKQLFCLGIHFKDDDGGDHCGGLFIE
jgi:hypothetical protein